MSRSRAAKKCRRCRGFDHEVYRYYLGAGYEFDVEAAQELVRDGREPVEVDPESLAQSVEYSRIDDAHVGHVDPTIPGLIAHVWYTGEDGETFHGHLLIDGNHRAARCLRERQPFFAHILSEDESRAVLCDGSREDRPAATA